MEELIMGPVVEKLVLWILQMVLTPSVIKGAEQDFVNFLAALAAKSPGKVDDVLVKLLADALGCQVPDAAKAPVA
jgi:hypothetical protein